MLNAAELIRRRNQVLGAIDNMALVDAMAVMGAAMRELAEQASMSTPVMPAPPSVELILEGNTRSRVERDPEIRDFIHSVRGCATVDQLVEACQERFGPRCPSRSAIHRYIQRLKFRQNQKEQDA